MRGLVKDRYKNNEQLFFLILILIESSILERHDYDYDYDYD